MGPGSYIDKFETVVDLLRVTGNYAAVALVDPNTYEVTSNVDTYLEIGDYLTLTGIGVRVTSIISDKVFHVIAFEAIVLSGVWKSLAPYSDYGTRRTINMKLMEKNGGEFTYQKYPLIALRLAAPISVANGIATLDANILIANFTDQKYRPEERIENVFIPILRPLASLFLEMIRKSGEYNGFEPGYTWIERLFYGTETGEENIANIFDDPLDAIELRGLRLTYFIDECI